MIERVTTYPPTTKTQNVLYLSTRREINLFWFPVGWGIFIVCYFDFLQLPAINVATKFMVHINRSMSIVTL